jgi:hypothetical protein
MELYDDDARKSTLASLQPNTKSSYMTLPLFLSSTQGEDHVDRLTSIDVVGSQGLIVSKRFATVRKGRERRTYWEKKGKES